jgi:acetyl esterase/lipase
MIRGKPKECFMKQNVSLGSLILFLAALLVPVAACQKTPETVVERNLVYGKGGDTSLQLDLAMPKAGDGPFPAIVFLHGRGWRAGNRQEMSHFIEGAARMGFVGVTIEYRLAPAARFPAQVEDCKAAVRWLRASILEGEGHGFTDANNQKAVKQMFVFLGEQLRRTDK